jgi:hypothetical protein
LVVGAVQLTVAVPPAQVQVSVYDLLEVMVASVSLPEANFEPLQSPLAVQPEATGEVDQVRTGVRLPVAEVWLAVKVMVPAVCARAKLPSNNRDNANTAWDRFFIMKLTGAVSKRECFRR